MVLNHLAVRVPDVGEARRFYERYFGFQFGYERGNGVVLKGDGGFYLALDPLNSGEHVEFPSWFHFGFCLKNPAAVRDLFQTLRGAGIEMIGDLVEYGNDAVNFYCCSPGGYRLEVFAT